MKKIHLITLAIVAVVTLAVWIFYSPGADKSVPEVVFSGPEHIEDDPHSLPEGVPNSEEFKSEEDIKAFIAKEGPVAGVAKLMAAGTNQPIEFYARVVDQYDNPIDGADIEMTISQDVPLSGWTRVSAKTRTDANGEFTITGVRGEIIRMKTIRKTGYIFNNSINQSFWSWPSTAEVLVNPTTIDKPWVYKGWKIEEVADIKTFNIGGKIIPDGRPYSVKLTKNSPERIDFHEGSNGDITISITRNVTPKGDRWFSYERNSWTFNLKVADGGLIQIPDAEASGYMYKAPESGYVGSISIESSKDSENWQSEFKQHYYIKLGNSHIYGYSLVYVGPFFHEDYSDINIRASLNFNGSRNLLSQSEMGTRQ